MRRSTKSPTRSRPSLIDVSSKLDELGFGAIGGLHFRLNRSAYYVREFNILLKTLRIHNIPTWTSYEQFVRRGLAPAFHYMASVGKRLRAVRTRLLTITETIETTALVGQSAATRHNTAVLRRTTTIAIVILLIVPGQHQPGPRERRLGLAASSTAACRAG